MVRGNQSTKDTDHLSSLTVFSAAFLAPGLNERNCDNWEIHFHHEMSKWEPFKAFCNLALPTLAKVYNQLSTTLDTSNAEQKSQKWHNKSMAIRTDYKDKFLAQKISNGFWTHVIQHGLCSWVGLSVCTVTLSQYCRVDIASYLTCEEPYLIVAWQFVSAQTCFTDISNNTWSRINIQKVLLRRIRSAVDLTGPCGGELGLRNLSLNGKK